MRFNNWKRDFLFAWAKSTETSHYTHFILEEPCQQNILLNIILALFPCDLLMRHDFTQGMSHAQYQVSA